LAGELEFVGVTDTTVHIVLNDQGHTGGGALEGSDDIIIDVNERPVVGNTGPAVTYQELAAPVTIDPDLTVDDPDGTTIDHASVQIAPSLFGGSGFVDGDELRINGALSGTVGLISWNFDDSTDTLSLTGASTEQAYQDLLRLVSFNNTTGNPTFFGLSPSRTITWEVNDGAVDNSPPTTTTVTIDPINSPPALVGLVTPRTYTEGSVAFIGRDEFADGLQVADADGPFPIKGGTITISGGHTAGDRITWFDLASGDDLDDAIEFTFDAVTGVFIFTTVDSGPDYDSFFRNLRFSFRSDDNPANLAFGDDPTAGGTSLTRTFTWVIDDGSASNNLSTPVDQLLDINAINDTPVNTAPTGPLAVDEDTDLTITGLSIADADAGSGTVTTTFTVVNSTITICTPSGETVTGTGSGSVMLHWSTTSRRLTSTTTIRPLPARTIRPCMYLSPRPSRSLTPTLPSVTLTTPTSTARRSR
jgi:hypothetical protein